jgi:diadenosine tetraphosphate (Ap4A) HIT family hydrolase
VTRDGTDVGCVFCGGAPGNERVAESARFVAVADDHPVTIGHALVVPRRHVESLFDLTADEVAEAYDLLREVRAGLLARYAPIGFNVGVNDGRAAGAEVDHLCVHLIPRYPLDTADPRGGVRHTLPDVGTSS